MILQILGGAVLAKTLPNLLEGLLQAFFNGTEAAPYHICPPLLDYEANGVFVADWF